MNKTYLLIEVIPEKPIADLVDKITSRISMMQNIGDAGNIKGRVISPEEVEKLLHVKPLEQVA